MIDNSEVYLQTITNEFGTDQYPSVYVNAEFALDMGWFLKRDDTYVISPNLVIEVLGEEIPVPTDTGKNGDQYWMQTPDEKNIRLSLTCNWRFINLNDSFKHVTSSTDCSLFIYSDVGGSGVVGNQVTDLLREVNYRREGKGSQYFEPLHIQYIPVRKEIIYIIETQVPETTGKLTKFGEGNTIVTLHFKRT